MTYEQLGELTGIAHSTLRSIGSQLGYRPTLGNIERICRALDVTPGDLLELIDDPPNAKPKRKKLGGGPTMSDPIRGFGKPGDVLREIGQADLQTVNAHQCLSGSTSPDY